MKVANTMKLRFVTFAFALGVLAFALTGCGDRDTEISTRFPEKHQVRVTLPAQGTGEEIRYVLMYPDGKTPREMRIEFVNGTAKVFRYREDGKLLELKEFYTAEDSKASVGQKDEYERQLKKVVVFDPALKAAASAEFFRKDGTREAQGRRQPDGSVEQTVFRADGRSVDRYQIFAKDGKVTNERVFGDSGNTLLLARRLDNGNLETTLYRGDGTRDQVSVSQENGWEDIDFFKSDGNTRWLTVRRYYTIGAVYYDDKGETLEYREFRDNEMKVVRYKPGTGKTSDSWEGVVYDEDFTQYWKVEKRTTDDGKTEEVYKLDRVEVAGADGKVSRRLTYTDSDGGYLLKVEDYEDGVTTQVRVFRKDGTVERIDYYDAGRLDHSQEVAAEKAMTEKVENRYSKDTPFVDPRPMVKPPVPVPPPTWTYPEDEYHD